MSTGPSPSCWFGAIEDNVYASLHPIDELALSNRISSTSRQQHSLTRTYARFGVLAIDSVATPLSRGIDSDRLGDYLPTRTRIDTQTQTKTFLKTKLFSTLDQLGISSDCWIDVLKFPIRDFFFPIEDNVYASLHPIDELALSIRRSSTSRQQHSLTRTYARFDVRPSDRLCCNQSLQRYRLG